jgi:hypothetical protein
LLLGFPVKMVRRLPICRDQFLQGDIHFSNDHNLPDESTKVERNWRCIAF